MAKAAKKEKTELQVISNQSSALDFGGKFKVVRQVTLPTFKLTVGVPFAFRADAPMYTGKKLKDDKDAKREPATILPVSRINTSTGEVDAQGQLVLGAVLKENLSELYANDSYVGKSFGILKMDKKEGKRYNEYQIVEISAA